MPELKVGEDIIYITEKLAPFGIQFGPNHASTVPDDGESWKHTLAHQVTKALCRDYNRREQAGEL